MAAASRRALRHRQGLAHPRRGFTQAVTLGSRHRHLLPSHTRPTTFQDGVPHFLGSNLLPSALAPASPPFQAKGRGFEPVSNRQPHRNPQQGTKAWGANRIRYPTDHPPHRCARLQTANGKKVGGAGQEKARRVLIARFYSLHPLMHPSPSTETQKPTFSSFAVVLKVCLAVHRRHHHAQRAGWRWDGAQKRRA